MNLYLSTGLRNALATNYGLGLIMNGGIIYVYGGSRPASADAAPGTDLLGRITTEGKTFYHGGDVNNAGLQLKFLPPAALGQIGLWVLKGVDTGVATWFRWCWVGPESLEDSDFYPRVDGDIGDAFRLPNPNITAATETVVDSFLIEIPAT